MAPSVLPSFPVDDDTLDLLETAISTPGVSVAGVLDLLAGGDDSDGATLYHFTDVISALIAEVRRLRSE